MKAAGGTGKASKAVADSPRRCPTCRKPRASDADEARHDAEFDCNDCPHNGGTGTCWCTTLCWEGDSTCTDAASTSRRFIVRRSLMDPALLSYGQWDDDKDRLSAGKAKEALSRLLTDLGAEPGDEVELTARITKKVEA